MKALLVAALMASAVPEPSGYWTGPNQGDTPMTVAGATVIHTAQLAKLIAKKDKPVLIDVSPAPPPPPDLPPGTVFMPPPHRDIPGSVWLQEAGRGEISGEAEDLYRGTIQRLTGGNLAKPVVLYCHPKCWLSWNAAKRAVSFGYRHVYWYPDGIEGWREAGKGVTSTEVLKQ
jgi:PQQ-dependent catabolism-associated CXXCW motif protein